MINDYHVCVYIYTYYDISVDTSQYPSYYILTSQLDFVIYLGKIREPNRWNLEPCPNVTICSTICQYNILVLSVAVRRHRHGTSPGVVGQFEGPSQDVHLFVSQRNPHLRPR